MADVLRSDTPAWAGTGDVTPAVTLRSSALLGAAGAVLVAFGSDLPGSPYGPHAGGLWPFAGTGPAPGWEGPTIPSWASVADQGPGVGAGRLLATAAVVVGVGLLALAWVVLWRRVHQRPDVGVHRLWWVVGAWVAPMLFAAPLASQDVWTYGAEGKMVLDGFGGYSTGSVLGHSVWTSGVDAKWLAHPAPYGPGELDLSAFFVRISGGRPWVAAECWRVAAILGLLLCAWGVTRIVSLSAGDGRSATVAGVANPAILLVLVAGIHNDALMLGLTVAGLAVALSGRRTWGLVLCALGVAVKPNALLVLGALAWWTWGSRWRDRTKGALVAAVVLVGVLVVGGIGVGGGFGWMKADIFSGGADGVWSLGAQLTGAETGWLITAVELAGAAVAARLCRRDPATPGMDRRPRLGIRRVGRDRPARRTLVSHLGRRSHRLRRTTTALRAHRHRHTGGHDGREHSPPRGPVVVRRGHRPAGARISLGPDAPAVPTGITVVHEPGTVNRHRRRRSGARQGRHGRDAGVSHRPSHLTLSGVGVTTPRAPMTKRRRDNCQEPY